MRREETPPSRSERGVSLVELVVGMVLLTSVLLGLAGAAGAAARQTYRAKVDLEMWSAIQSEVDSLISVGWGTVASGSDTKGGYPMSWTVSGTNPKRIEFEVERMDLTNRTTVRDTLVFFMARQNP